MSKLKALLVVIKDANSEKASKTSYKRLKLALEVLGLDDAEQRYVESALGYRNRPDGDLYPYFSD